VPDVFLAKGTRDFLPAQMHRRLAVIDRVRAVFTQFGFEPLETPAFERIETLTGKYGEEGQQLIFKILKRGEGGETGGCDQALRYDLTVPLARVVAMNPDLRLPFKRWQIAPVWRADRPAKGRFREFYQCDADIVGAEGPLADAECLAVAAAALTALGFPAYTIRLNDRRVLRAMAAAVGAEDREGPLLVAIDKLDKIGVEGVSAELAARGFDAAQIALVWAILAPQPDNAAALAALTAQLQPRLGDRWPEAEAGIRAIAEVAALAEDLGVPPGRVRIDPTLARGLDYYTGPVFEAVVEEPKVGSFAGGGRYDGLIGMFSGRRIPAVGISLGLERVLAVLDERDRDAPPPTAAQAIVLVWDAARRGAAIAAARSLREAGITADLFLGDAAFKNQLKYANGRGYPFAVLVGPSEAERGLVAVKDLRSGEQVVLTLDQAAEHLRAARAAAAGPLPKPGEAR
jgi:histidyl-tRNA synthetase